MSVLLDWVEESKKFDQMFETYDLYRPSYPEALINKIILKSNIDKQSKVLEVGAGSGKATELFVDRGLKIHCIEQGPNLVNKGLDKFKDLDQVSYECVSFQEWEIEENTYDMIFSAQAFHWIPKPQGYKTLAKALKDKGQMMIFWNKYVNLGDKVSAELAGLLKEFKILTMLDHKEMETYRHRTYDGIYTTDLFEEIEIFEYPWELEYSYHDFINFLTTMNTYISLASQKKHSLNVGLMELFSKNNDKIIFNFDAVLFSARKC